MKILVLASLTTSLVKFRRALLDDFTRAPGADVIACAPEYDKPTCDDLSKMGVRFKQIPMARTSMNPFSDLRTIKAIADIIRDEKPDIIVAYTQKPIIYGGIAARLVGGNRFFALQSGLGYIYSPENKNNVLRRFVSFLYKIALARAEAVFVFNGADAAEMRDYGIIGDRHRVIQVAGSGVNSNEFSYAPTPEQPQIFLLVARLMKDKGLYEFVEAARRVRAVSPDARFQILGPFDSNPASIRKSDLENWISEGVVEYLGETDDVRPFLAKSTVFVLPSFHREGLPRSILEAMSVGRAIITTDMPGCRETVVEGKNGFLIPPQNASALATAMTRFVKDPTLAQAFGAYSRKRVEETFDVRHVNETILNAMSLNENSNGAALPIQAPIEKPKIRLADRILNGFIGGVALIYFLPLIALLSVAVLLTIGRPIFFSQMRAGRNGAPFKIIKFRTMRDLRDKQGALKPDKNRLTPFGRFLRRFRLDELPELWNILIGEMAIVGPRPLLLDSLPNVDAAGRERLSVPPGLTGWAQVNGNASLSDEDKLQLDLWYVRNRSFKLDAYIILLTLKVIFGGEKVNSANIQAAYESNHRRSC